MEIPPAKEQFGGSNVNPNGEKYYVTTAINYTNGVPHIGHMYEALLADVVARYNRVYGRKVFFLTGTDEHGQKIAKSAEAAGKTPKEQCDMYVEAFQALNKRLHISNDEYIRTTDPYHEESCRALWKRCCDNGDIYLGSYNGWYDEGEENFVTPANAEKQGFKDAFGRDLKQIKESCYFFRLSKYGDRLKEYHSSRPDSIIPENRRQEVLSMLEDGLQDLCISRTTFDWGISLPEGFEEKHVMYVWFDALTNYVSATHLLLPEDRRDPERVQNWPADAHIIGKDITRFHCIYWPAMLWSAGLELPKSVVGHGFVQDENGQKMSKSLGNVIDPNDLLDKYPSDSVRFFMCNEAAFGSDLKASETSLVQTHNTNLANTVGNLVMRAIRLTRLYTDGEVPAKPEGVTLELPFDLDELRTNVETWMKAYQTNKVVSEVVKACSEVNNLITVKEPFKMKEESQRPLRTLCVRIILESVYILAHFLAPFLPLTATAILEKIQPGTTIAALKADFTNLEAGRKLSDSKYAETGEGSVVPFEKILTDEERAKAEQKQKLAEEAKKKAAEKAAKGGAGKHADPKKPAPKAAAEEKPEFDASGWRLGVKSDLAQRWYLQEQGDKQYPDVSGVLTLSDGLFDMAVYAKDESASGNVLHTENGPLKQLLARTGGTKFDAKTSTVTLKPHHSTDASEVAKDATPKKYVVKVSKKGALKFEADGDSTVWCKRRQL